MLFVAFFATRLYLQKRQVDAEIRKLQAQADEIAQNNQELSGLIKYLNTPEFAEKQAREQLNLKKDGEYVVVLPDTDEPASPDAAQPKAGTANPSLWFDYFFHQPKS